VRIRTGNDAELVWICAFGLLPADLPRFLLVILCLTFLGRTDNFGTSWAKACPDHGDQPANTAEWQAQPTQETDGLCIRMAALTGVSARHSGKLNKDQGANRKRWLPGRPF